MGNKNTKVDAGDRKTNPAIAGLLFYSVALLLVLKFLEIDWLIGPPSFISDINVSIVIEPSPLSVALLVALALLELL